MSKTPAILAVLVLGLTACSAQQLHSTGQAWQRSLCDKRSGDDRTRCLDDANQSYSNYQRGIATTQTEK